MSAPDKCPNCNSERVLTKNPHWYSCETHESCYYSNLFSPLCKERAARQKAEKELAETRKELEKAERELDKALSALEEAERQLYC